MSREGIRQKLVLGSKPEEHPQNVHLRGESYSELRLRLFLYKSGLHSDVGHKFRDSWGHSYF